ncbi:hypothetical protein [Caldisericum sp.]|uniref:hypothetical protein n=1 Tax=Caldisericum sp. TaxID=2499687 RepID=UPI003D111505
MPKRKIFFWSKLATKPEEDNMDKLTFNDVEEDQSIRNLIMDLEDKMIGNKRDFNNINPNNPSVKKWIKEIIASYPEPNNDRVEDLINEFRSVLRTKSKEKEKFIICILQLNDVLVISHCKKDPSLAEIKDKLYSVKTVLHPKNIIRADIIKNEDGKLTISTFVYNKIWTKGHANFWGIDPEDISWESLGNIILDVELESFHYHIHIPIEKEQLKNMIDQQIILPTGKIKIGREEGKISKVFVYRKMMEYPQFYDFYVTETEKLDNYKKKFRAIIDSQPTLNTFTHNLKYQYEEDETNLYKITTDQNEIIVKKNHPRFTICFFTKKHPGIKPNNNLILKIYESIFNNRHLEIWHAGEESSLEPFKIGNLKIYNKISIPDELTTFSMSLLNEIQDSQSKKAKFLLQSCFCKFYFENLKNKHFKYVFDFLEESIINKEIASEFKQNGGLLEEEKHIEFKSADDVLSKPTQFVKEKLVPTIRKYTNNGNLKRYCILYGIEDNGSIKPINHLKSDQITNIENIANSELEENNIRISILSIPFKGAIVLAVFIIPKFLK